jgi:hypothetical protein
MGQDSPAFVTRFDAATPDLAVLVATRRRLHGIAECLMAGPQRRAGGRFTLRVTPGGFATALRLDGADLVVDESMRVVVAGTFGEMAEALGVEFGAPPDAYPTAARQDRATTPRSMPRRLGSSRTGI